VAPSGLMELLGPLEQEREEKLLAMFTDRQDHELARLRRLTLSRGLEKKELDRVEGAIAFARKQNYGERLRDKQYVSHASRVALLTAAWAPKGSNADPVVAALVHNAIEKGIATAGSLEKDFGAEVSRIVVALTLDREAMKTDAGKIAYYAALDQAPAAARAIKIFDKFDNLLSLCANPDEQVRQKYLAEAEAWILPLVQRMIPEFTLTFAECISENRRIGHYAPTY
jgi:(p)ppGpp synthase/HD superfamily hydrolase